jgi:alpha-glucosidase (family GH31 glycosyl hydrolase)
MQDFLNGGIKTINITEPYIVEYSSNFQTAYNNGYFTFNSQGQPALIPGWWSCGGCNAGLLDITNPDAQQWWWNKHPAFFGNELAGIWTDLGEPEAHPELMNHFLGSRNKVHNIFNFLWAELIFKGINQTRPNKRVFNLIRSGFAGIQRFGVIPWSGDVAKHFGGLKVQLPMLLNMGMSGLGYHNSDIGGFCCGTTTPELYVRWMQYGTFCPIARAHGIDNQPTEPWGFGSEAEQISKKYIELRYKLLPYIYTMTYENYKTGMPLARPLLFDYPEVISYNNYSNAYMWGPSFLVAPVVDQNHITKNVSFPVGEWVDFYTDNVIVGGGSYVVQAPLDKLPLFVKRGSIIPLQPVMNFTDEFLLDTLILEIYPTQFSDASFSLYEDDGISLDYQSGDFAITELAQSITANNDLLVNIGASTGNFNGKLTHKIYLSNVHHVGAKPSTVLLNNNLIPERSSYQQLRNSENGFYFDEARRKLSMQHKGSTDSSYEIKAVDIVLSNAQIKETLPTEFVFYQNYPNPFNSTTNIKFIIPSVGAYSNTPVQLKIYDVLGSEIATLVNEEKPAGSYEVEWNAPGLPSGVYFYRFRAGSYSATKKMVLMK